MPDVRITSSSATRDKYGISFRVRTDSDIVLDLTKSQTASNTGVCIFGQNMNDFDPSIKKGQVD